MATKDAAKDDTEDEQVDEYEAFINVDSIVTGDIEAESSDEAEELVAENFETAHNCVQATLPCGTEIYIGVEDPDEDIVAYPAK